MSKHRGTTSTSASTPTSTLLPAITETVEKEKPRSTFSGNEIVPPVPAALLEKPAALIMAESRTTVASSAANGVSTNVNHALSIALSPGQSTTTSTNSGNREVDSGISPGQTTTSRCYMNDPRFRRKKAQAEAGASSMVDSVNLCSRYVTESSFGDEKEREIKPIANALLAGFYKAADENDV